MSPDNGTSIRQEQEVLYVDTFLRRKMYIIDSLISPNFLKLKFMPVGPSKGDCCEKIKSIRNDIKFVCENEFDNITTQIDQLKRSSCQQVRSTDNELPHLNEVTIFYFMCS